MRGSMILVAALFAAMLGPTRLVAQTHRDMVVSLLDAATAMKKSDGFRPDGEALPRDVVVGALPAGGSVVLELSLKAGATYFIGGACDEDCSDMDMWVIDPEEGTTLAEDIEVDSVPMLQFVAPRTGTYFLSVMMYECAEEFCIFGYQVLRR